MLLTTSKIIVSMMCSITIIYIMNVLNNYNISKSKYKLVLLLIVLTIITFISSDIKYNYESIIFKIMLYIVIYKIIYNESIYKTIVSIFIAMAFILSGDLILNLLLINLITIEQVRGVWYWIIICNSLVYIITLLIINIPKLKEKAKKFIVELDENKKSSTIFLIVISVLIIIYVFYNISINYQWSKKYIINVIIVLTYFIIIIIFLKDKNEYNKLMRQYDTLFDYFKEFEDSIDDISLVNHEYQNQLSIIKSYIRSNDKKEALKYISELSNEYNLDNHEIISSLKNIPKGGIKGLLYYKIITASNKGVKIFLDVSKNVKTIFKKLSHEENKILSKIVGVLIDNSIDAALNLDNKIVSVEIYEINKNINIVISNKIENKNLDIK